MPATWWSSMARTNCRMARRSIPAQQTVRTVRAAVPRLRLRPKMRHKGGARQRAALEDLRNESVTAVHSTAGRHHPLDGRRPSGGLGRFPAIAHLGVAASRLPHDSGTDVLSRRQPRSNGFFGDGSSRAPIRTNSRFESDDFHEFLRELDDYAAIQFVPEYRRR